MLKVILILALAALTQGTWVIDWSDEFVGEEGWSPDGNKWDFDIGGDGWGNGELQYYTSDPSNAQQDGEGHLLITARSDDAAQHQCWYGICWYTSARVITSGMFQQTYGRFEARIKVPSGRGTWPSFWLLGSDINTGTPWPTSGEIDIMEVRGSDPRTVLGTIHGPGYSGADGKSSSYISPVGTKLSDDFHVYAVEWTPESITWFIDDILYGTQTRAEVEVSGPWVFDHEFYIILDFAVGGTYEGAPSIDTPFPQSMIVDYVRVFHQE